MEKNNPILKEVAEKNFVIATLNFIKIDLDEPSFIKYEPEDEPDYDLDIYDYIIIPGKPELEPIMVFELLELLNIPVSKKYPSGIELHLRVMLDDQEFDNISNNFASFKHALFGLTKLYLNDPETYDKMNFDLENLDPIRDMGGNDVLIDALVDLRAIFVYI